MNLWAESRRKKKILLCFLKTRKGSWKSTWGRSRAVGGWLMAEVQQNCTAGSSPEGLYCWWKPKKIVLLVEAQKYCTAGGSPKVLYCWWKPKKMYIWYKPRRIVLLVEAQNKFTASRSPKGLYCWWKPSKFVLLATRPCTCHGLSATVPFSDSFDCSKTDLMFCPQSFRTQALENHRSRFKEFHNAKQFLTSNFSLWSIKRLFAAQDVRLRDDAQGFKF